MYIKYFFISFLLTGCVEKVVYEKNKIKNEDKLYIKENKKLFDNEQKLIKQFIKSTNKKYTSLNDGSFIRFKKYGKGTKAEFGDLIKLKLHMVLLDNDTVYSSKKKELVEFVVGKREINIGLDKISNLLQEGDQFSLILPNYLAFGVRGVYEKIPMHSPIIYYIEVVDIKKPQKNIRLN